MKNKICLIITCILVLGFVGCSTTNIEPNGNDPDRGTIPVLDPIKPPSMTNEWEEVDAFILEHGSMVGKQKMVIEVAGERTEYILGRRFGSF